MAKIPEPEWAKTARGFVAETVTMTDPRGEKVMDLILQAMKLEMAYGIRVHFRFELVDGQGNPVEGGG